MTMTEFDTAQFFTMAGTPLLESGQTMTRLGMSSQLWMHIKVYASGGENSLHSHPYEDHAFVVLAGEATFTLADGTKTVRTALDGALMPRGVEYMFQSTGQENLVMLRAGASDHYEPRRQGEGGKAIKSAGEGVVTPGEFFSLR